MPTITTRAALTELADDGLLFIEVTSKLGMTVTLEDATRISLSHNLYAADI